MRARFARRSGLKGAEVVRNFQVFPMKLIGSFASPFVRKVRIVLAEKIDYDLEIDNLSDESGVPPQSVAQIPVLVLEDGTALYDSRVIVEFWTTSRMQSSSRQTNAGASRCAVGKPSRTASWTRGVGAWSACGRRSSAAKAGSAARCARCTRGWN
jgi:hypothetical protein